MSETKWTEGPWELVVGGNFVHVGGAGYTAWAEANHYSGGPLSIARVEYHAAEDFSSNRELAIAHGHLLSAARELYEALDGALRLLEMDGSKHNIWRAALAKARGEAA